MKIANKVFIITGGASGLGAASAKRIVAAGGKVVMADLNKEAGEALAKELGANAAFSMTNVADEASAQACIDFAVSHFGGLHGLINCAGVGPAEKVLGKNGVHALASFTRTININVIGTFNILRLATVVMSASEASAGGERGVIINTASVAAFDGQIGQAGYSAIARRGRAASRAASVWRRCTRPMRPMPCRRWMAWILKRRRSGWRPRRKATG